MLSKIYHIYKQRAPVSIAVFCIVVLFVLRNLIEYYKMYLWNKKKKNVKRNKM